MSPKWNQPVVVNFLLALSFGIGFAFSYFHLPTQAQVLGQATSTMQPVMVMRVRSDENNSPVIVPKKDVYKENGCSYVLVLEKQQIVKRQVVSQLWRDEYAQIVSGLHDQDLVVLDQRVSFNQQLANYQIINPEAGPSGLIEKNN